MKIVWYQTIPCDLPREPKKMKNFIKHKVIAVENYLCIWSFLDFWHEIYGKLDVIEKKWLWYSCLTGTKLLEWLSYFPVTSKKVKKRRPVLYTSLYMIINLFSTFFLWEETYLKLEIVDMGENYSFRNTWRMQNIEFVG